MAKHSKGKHAAHAAGKKNSWRTRPTSTDKAKDAASDGASSEAASGAAGASEAGAEQDAKAVEDAAPAVKAADEAESQTSPASDAGAGGNASSGDKVDAEDTAGSEGAAEAKAAEGPSSDAAKDAADPSGDREGSPTAPDSASKDTADKAGGPAHADGAHAATAILDDIPKRSRAKVAAIVCGSIVGVLAIIYFVGVFIFSGHYLPNTYVAGMDFSLETPEEMSETLDATLDDYSFTVVGKGMDFTVTSADANLSSDSDQVAHDVLAEANPWAWPIEAFETRDLTDVFTHAISANGLSDIVTVEVEEANGDAVLPVNATIAFDEATGGFVVVEEIPGTAIDGNMLLEEIIAGLMNFDDRIELTDEVLVQPTIFSDDPRIAQAIEQADALVKADFDLTLADNLVTEVNPKLSSGWVTVSPDLEIAFNDGALTEWAEEVSSGCNTIGSQRTYTRPDGKTVTVSGGTYGWKVDKDALVEQVVAAVKAGSTEDIAIPALQSGTGFSGLGDKDWGSRYVDVDLSQQYARFYDGDSIIWESPIVSGNPNKGNSTPQGVWSLNTKGRNVTLTGRAGPDGVPEYETPVSYWMPFKGNSVGFHDANWQSSFGGSRYLSHGSHGCVNLPYSAAQALFGIIQTGDVVVVHR